MRTNSERIAVGYARVSTSKQSEGWGLTAQRWRLEQWRSDDDLPLGDVVVDDGVSTRRSRPALEALRNRVRAGEIGTVVVVKLDRLGRSVKELVTIAEELRTADCELVSLSEGIDTSQATGRFLFHILSAVAELEREMISERTQAGLDTARASGVRMGRPPLASVDVDTRAAELATEGLSLRAIGDKLSAEGFSSPTGGTWHPTSVRRCIHRGKSRQQARPA